MRPPEVEFYHLEYVSEQHPYMRAAQEHAHAYSLDPDHPTGAVIVQEGEIIGRGANGSDYHEKHGCVRKRQGVASGTHYELCEGCAPKNHAEQRAVKDAHTNGHATEGATLYLWGHYWCCAWCTECMRNAGIERVFLSDAMRR